MKISGGQTIKIFDIVTTIYTLKKCIYNYFITN